MEIVKSEIILEADELVSVFCNKSFGFALESTLYEKNLGKWSFYGSDPFKVISDKDGLESLRFWMEKYSISNFHDIPFIGGAVGFFSYDFCRELESIPSNSKDDLSMPLFLFGLYDGVVARDNYNGDLFLIASEVNEKASLTFNRLNSKLASYNKHNKIGNVSLGRCKWNTTKEGFCKSVNEIKKHIREGEVYQVNLSRRWEAEFSGDILDLYKALRIGNPAPYAGYFNANDFQIISTSPEQFIKKKEREISTRPIKGTRPRGLNVKEDLIYENDLINSEKDRAELLMIVDLERNDFGRIAKIGSVSAKTEFEIEYYKSVMHATTQVKAILDDNYDVIDIFTSIFPGGSITGAPKIKAMEIIDRLEPNRRGAYCGALGYISFNQDIEFNISIRTLQYVNGKLYYSVGSGIVWDSDPIDEFNETVDKAKAIQETLDSICLK